MIKKFLIKVFLVLLLIPGMINFSTEVNGQGTCATAALKTQDSTLNFQTYYTTVNDYWIKFVATSDNCRIILKPSVSTPNASIDSIILYGGTCTSLSLLSFDSQKQILEINKTNLIKGNTYYVKVSRSNTTNGYFDICLSNSGLGLTISNSGNSDFCKLEDNNHDQGQELSIYCDHLIEACVGETIILTPMDYHTSPEYTFEWYIGGSFGISFSEPTATSHTGHFYDPGYYIITFIELKNGANWEIVRIGVTINEKPDANFTIGSNPACVGYQIGLNITNQSSYNLPTSGGVTWGDGYYSPIPNLSHIYQQAGNYNISLSLTNQCGTDSKTKPITVINATADFSATTVCLGNATQFTDLSSCNNQIIQWNWDFGDGTTGTGQNPTHVYSSAGTYTVVLTIQDTWSQAISTKTKSVTVNALPAISEIIGNNNICSSNTNTYSVSNIQSGCNYTWAITTGTGTFLNGINTGTSVTVTWSSVPSIPAYASLTITATNSSLCNSTTVYKVFECCHYSDAPNWLDNTVLSTKITGAYAINGILTVTGNSSISGSFFMGPEAKIKINPGCTLTVSNSTIRSGCNYMWDGIYINNSNADVINTYLDFNGSTMSDAINGIVSTKGGKYKIYNNSSLLNNYQAILAQNYNPTYYPGIPRAAFPGQIYATTISNNAADYKLTLPPFANVKSMYAIKIDKVYDITIGDINQNRVAMNNTVYGVYATDADLKIYKSDFTNNCVISTIASVDANNNPLEGAVYARKVDAFLANINPNLVFGGQNINNTITSSNFGVFAYGQQAVINYNTIDTRFSAITCKEMKTGTEVKNNAITQALGTGLLGTSVLLQNVNTSPSGILVTVSGNTINPKSGYAGFTTGIYTTNLKTVAPNNVTISANTINFAGSSTNDRYGIRIEACDLIDVACNNIKNTVQPSVTYAHKLRGISVSNTLNGRIHDNGTTGDGLKYLGSGIRGVGVLTGTKFTCNKLDKNFYGFYFDPNVTTISTQGGSRLASDNYWIDGGYTNSYRIEGQLTSVVNWYYYGTTGTQAYCPNIVLAQNIAHWVFQVGNINHTTCSCTGYASLKLAEPEDSVLRAEMIGEIVKQDISYANLDEEFTYMNKYHAFEFLDSDTAMLKTGAPDDSEYMNFYTDALSSNQGLLRDVNKIGDTLNFALALQKNNTISAANKIETNRKKTNEIYLGTFAVNKAIDTIQQQELFAIATQTPYIGGNAVYSARVMLGIDAGDYGLTYKETPESLSNVNSIVLYPNPATDEVTIVFNDGNTAQCEIELFDIAGNKIATHQLSADNNFTLKTAFLSNGIYICKVYVNGSSKWIEKLIIVK